MTPKAIIVALVGVGCVGAAGLGAYLAVRSSADPLAAPAIERRAENVPSGRSSVAFPERAAVQALQPPPAQTGSPSEVSATPRPSIAGKQGAGAPAAPPATASSMTPARPAQDNEAEAPPPAPILDQPQVPPTEAAAAPPAFDERTVPADAVIGIRLETAVSSETARVEDRVIARVTREVKIDGQTAIPTGAQLEGFVTMVERGGKMRDRSRIGLRFAMLVVGDERIPIQTEAIFRDGESPANEATSKIGASAVVGTILGAVMGGKRGAVAGTVVGAAGGTAAVMAGGRNEASIPAGTPLTVRLTAPVTVLAAHEE